MPNRNLPRVVIITALRVEYEAVRAYLTELKEIIHEKGTLYESGIFTSSSSLWEVIIVEVGRGNSVAAIETERAISVFNPNVAFFIGVAGGIKDVNLGDVVAATKVYYYESGKSEKTFKTRPNLGNSSYRLQQRAQSVARQEFWKERILGASPSRTTKAFVEPIAAGEKVIASVRSETFKFLRKSYNDAIAVEMEGRGFLEAVFSNEPLNAIVIRGISDLINKKEEADLAGSQIIAARHASAFAFEVLSKFADSSPSEITNSGAEEKTKITTSIIQKNTIRAREALEPYILPRISRRVVHDKYLPAIYRGVREEKKRIVPIVGPAGYGKTTILGEIYDELSKSNAGWTVLIRCNDLSLRSEITPITLSVALGECITGQSIPFEHIAGVLTSELGRGVLLLDTLDLILDERVVPSLRQVLIQVIELGATIALTCRDFEYNAFLVPARDKLSGLTTSIDYYEVPQFSSLEVEQAAYSFIQVHPDFQLADKGQAFARAVRDLSADARPIQDITRNPLLLAMLCELFGKEGHVPEDLTVSKLYKQYWQEKIAKSRKFGHSSPELLAKEKLCMDIAKILFEMSRERLSESLYPTDIEYLSNGAAAAAYRELISEAVLKVNLGSGKVRFFHQTFLEYAISRWLDTISGEESKNSLLCLLSDKDSSPPRLHWWPIIRQFLTIIDRNAFDNIISRLNLSDLAAFRAVTFAAVSRDEPSVLLNLVPLALQQSDPYQEALLLGIMSTPNSLVETAWTVILQLLENGKKAIAINAAKKAGALLSRSGQSHGSMIDEALTAINNRDESREKISDENVNVRSEICGSLVKSYLQEFEKFFDIRVLSVLRKHYFSIGLSTRAAVIRAHLLSRVQEEEQRALLTMLIARQMPSELKEEATALLEKLLPSVVGSQHCSIWLTWLDALQADLPKGWDMVQARAIGHIMVQNLGLSEIILTDLLTGDEKLIGRNLVAIREAIDRGASGIVVSALLNIPVEIVPQVRFDALSQILKTIAETANQSTRESVASWLEPIAKRYSEKFTLALAHLACDSTIIQRVVVQLIKNMPHQQVASQIKKILKHTKNEIASELSPLLEEHLHMEGDKKERQLALVEVYFLQAKTSIRAIAKLREFSLGGARTAALTASAAMKSVACVDSVLVIEDLLPLATSEIAGVRVNCIDAMIQMMQRNHHVTDQHLNSLCATLIGEIETIVVQSLCKLIVCWIRSNQRIDPYVVRTIGHIQSSMIENGSFEGGAARSIATTLKNMAHIEDHTIIPLIGQCSITLLRSIDVKRLSHNGEAMAIDLLSAIARGDPSFLPDLVKNECSLLPERNVRAVAAAIKRVEGSSSPLLDRMVESNWCPSSVRGRILEYRRA